MNTFNSEKDFENALIAVLKNKGWEQANYGIKNADLRRKFFYRPYIASISALCAQSLTQ